jgi:hypothetical protein
MDTPRHIPFVQLHWIPFVVTLGVLGVALSCFFALAILAGSVLHGEPIGGSWFSSILAAPLIGFGVALFVVLCVALPSGCLIRRLRQSRKFPVWLPLLLSGPLFCIALLFLGDFLFAVTGGFLMGCGVSLYWLVLYLHSHRSEVDHVA